MLSGAESRLLADIAALRQRIETGRLKTPATIERFVAHKQWALVRVRELESD